MNNTDYTLSLWLFF